jgi:hypothetical protein
MIDRLRVEFITNDNKTQHYCKIIGNQAMCVKRRTGLSTQYDDSSEQDGQERRGD